MIKRKKVYRNTLARESINCILKSYGLGQHFVDSYGDKVTAFEKCCNEVRIQTQTHKIQLQVKYGMEVPHTLKRPSCAGFPISLK